MSIKLLHLDVETAPHIAYIWRLYDDYVPIDRIVESGYTLCWAANWDHEKEVMFDSVHQSSQKKMVKGIRSLIDEADVVVHYNGKKFDTPVLQQEMLEQGLTPPAPFKQIDLYHTVKQNFRFASNKLDYVAQKLGLGGKVKHKGMDLWKGCMAGNEADWRKMESYNKQDVRLLKALYHKLRPWIKNHPNLALYVDDAKPRCPTCGSKNLQPNRGTAKLTSGLYMRYHCQDCGAWPRGSTNLLTPAKRKAMLRT